MLIVNYFSKIEHVYQFTLIIVSLGLLIQSIEDWSVFFIFSKKGPLSWDIYKTTSSFFQKGIKEIIFNKIFHDSTFKLLINLRILIFLGILLLSFQFSSLRIITFLLICGFILQMLIGLRNSYSLDGAYHLNLILLFCLTAGIYSGIHSQAAFFSLIFITSQVLLSYFISGAAKIVSPIWRSNVALKGIFSTQIYGHQTVYALLSKSEKVTKMLSISVVIFEIVFFLALLSPSFVLAFALFGFLFHLFNAVFMGLNSFLFAFVGTYPALIYISIFLSKRL